MIDAIEMALIRTANGKFERGDPLSDKELARLLDFYEMLEWSLDVMGEEYNLARRPVQRNWDTLLSYQMHRNNK
mgnify:CR=1 FL=1